jgi:hypothetical protein
MKKQDMSGGEMQCKWIDPCAFYMVMMVEDWGPIESLAKEWNRRGGWTNLTWSKLWSLKGIDRFG